MIIYGDDAREEQTQGFDVCIIGAGAAGITLAMKLLEAKQRVLLIDSGDWKEDPALADAYVGHASAPHPETTEFRRQRFGGTTHLWGGRCVPLDAHDFEQRPHVPLSGWPVTLEELSPYYEEACETCDAGKANFDVTALSGEPVPMFAGLPALQHSIRERIERYSLPTDFGRKYREKLTSAEAATVLLKCRVISIAMNDAATAVSEVIVLTQSKSRRFPLRAKTYVIASGGIETTRMMLLARREHPSLSRFDSTLGKYYSCHFDTILGSVRFSGEQPKFDFERTTDGVYARRKLQFTSSFQYEHGLLNSCFRLHFPAYADASHGSAVLSLIYLVKSALPGEYQKILNHGQDLKFTKRQILGHGVNVIKDAPSLARFTYDYLFKILLAERRLPYTLIRNRNGSYPLEFNSEQIQHASNRIELTDKKDAAGVPRVDLHWSLQEADVRSAVQSFKLLREQMALTRIAEMDLPINLEEQVWQSLPVGGHHMGTTRMSLTSEEGVVDRNLKVHNTENLYLCSSSVFSSNGHANPTLTVVALANRLASHLVYSR